MDKDGYTTIDGHTGDLMTIEAFKSACEVGAFIDYDGHGDAVKDGEIITERSGDAIWPKWIKPSKLDEIPEGTTHILWYNR